MDLSQARNFYRPTPLTGDVFMTFMFIQSESIHLRNVENDD